jgi:hypothetical protein
MSSTDSTPSASAVATASTVSQLDNLGEQLRTLKASINAIEQAYKAASKEVSKNLKEANKFKKVKRARKGDYVPSEGQKAWNAYVANVRTELQKATPTATYKEAMIEAKRRRASGDPAAPKQSTTVKPAKAPKAKATAAPVAATPAPVAAATPAPVAKATKAPKAKVIKA